MRPRGLTRPASISQQLFESISSIPQHLDEFGTSLDQALDDHILLAEREKERLRMSLSMHSAAAVSGEESFEDRAARQRRFPAHGHELL